MNITASLASLADTFGNGLPWVLETALSNAAPIAGAACLAALASEALPWLITARDARTRFLARALGIDPRQIAPIPDGVQLWHDGKSRLQNPDPEGSVPLGGPTLKASYVFEKNGQLHLLVVHSTEDVLIQPDPEHPELADAVVGLLDHFTGNVHPAHIPIDADKDCAQKASLIEAVANMRFGYRGKVIPLVLWKDPEGVAPEPEDERTISNLVPAHLRLNDAAISGIEDPSAKLGRFDKSKGFSRLSRWLRTQPRRTTPLSRNILRAGVVLFCAWLTARSPGLAGHEILAPILDSIGDPADSIASWWSR